MSLIFAFFLPRDSLIHGKIELFSIIEMLSGNLALQ